MHICHFVFISGVDGTGKTTQAFILRRFLSSMGFTVKYSWIRGKGNCFFSLPLLAICRFLGITIVHKIDDNLRVSEHRFFLSRFLSFIWTVSQLLDTSLTVLMMRIKAKISSCDVYIIDRGPLDTLVDLMFDTRFKFKVPFIYNIFLSFIPKGSKVILLDADEKTVARRKRDIINLFQIRCRRRIYKFLAMHLHLQILSSSRPLINVSKDILKNVLVTL